MKKDIFRKTKGDKCGVKAEVCPDHGEELKILCRTCNNKIVCLECLVTKHSNHRYKKLADCYNEHIKEIKKKLADIFDRTTQLKIANEHFRNYEAQMLQQDKVLKMDIVTRYQKLADKLEEEKQSLLAKVNDKMQPKVNQVKQYRRNATSMIDHLCKAYTNIETCTKTWSKSKLVLNKKQLLSLHVPDMEEIRPILSRAQQVLKSPVDTNMKFQPQPIKDETMRVGKMQPQLKPSILNIPWFDTFAVKVLLFICIAYLILIN